MSVKLGLLGWLVYGAMAGYLGAFVAFLLRRSRLGHGLFAAGFALALAAFVTCWRAGRHLPLQNLFGVFLCLGMLMYPVSLFWRRFLGVGGRAADALIAFILLFPSGFVFGPGPQALPPALRSPLLAVHVGTYTLAYAILLKAAIEACRVLVPAGTSASGPGVSHELATYRLVRLGFPLLTLGLVLGAVWGKMAWGDYWHWDPKELWSLAMWLVYAVYFEVQRTFGDRYARLSSVIAVGGAVVIVITLLWVNLARVFAGLHSYAV